MPHPMRQADRYIGRIRNQAKKRYAGRYDAWITSGRRGPAPSSPELSVMGEQAVRLALTDIYEGWHHDGGRLVKES